VWSIDGELVSETSMKEEIVVTAFYETHTTKGLVACDAGGGLTSLTFQADKKAIENAVTLSIPVLYTNPDFTFYRPPSPARLASVVKVDADGIAESSSLSIPKPESYSASETASKVMVPSTWKKRIESDLADSQRALESIEQSRAQLLESLSQIEESAARLKQLIAIQEARLKQLEIAEEKK
jgi:hypothetical protein